VRRLLAATAAACTPRPLRRRIVWLPPAGAAAAAAGFALRYPQIVMHAVSTDPTSFARPCVYLQLDEGSEDGGGAGSGSGDEGEGEEGEEELGAEVRLVPADAAAGEGRGGGRLLLGTALICTRVWKGGCGGGGV
jgi:hypothetical protein